jgi:hypothetical protein
MVRGEYDSTTGWDMLCSRDREAIQAGQKEPYHQPGKPKPHASSHRHGCLTGGNGGGALSRHPF